MRKFRRLIRLLVFLAIALYIAAHLAIRTERGRAWAEARLSEKAGLDISAEAIRFSWGLGYRLTNVRASFRNAAGTECEVFSAPLATATRSCHGNTWLKASRAVLNVAQDATGAWTPAFGTRFSNENPEDFFRAASTTFGSSFFALEDATVSVSAADGSTVSYYGVSWKLLPVYLHGNDKIRGQFLRQGLLQVQCYVATPAGGIAITHSGAPVALDQNWLVFNDGTTFDLTRKEVAGDEKSVAGCEKSVAGCELRVASSETTEPTPEPETAELPSPAPEPETRNPEPATAKPTPAEPETRNPEPATAEPATEPPAPATAEAEPATRNPEPATAEPAPIPESK